MTVAQDPGCASLLGPRRGSDAPRTGISAQKDRDDVRAVTRVRPGDLHHHQAKLTARLAE